MEKVARKFHSFAEADKADFEYYHSLTPEQLRKVGEIEKLARSVKEKMSNSVGNTPVYQAPPLPRIR